MIAYLLPCLFLLVPLVVCALAIHWFERVIQQRLSSRFGWNSVLWTGWLGTPIHESSHALMCPVFRHRIDEVAFFAPDRKSGRLGYVRHSFHAGNWFEEMGNLFIGIAPLIGGSTVLLLLLYLFYPEAATAAFQTEVQAEVLNSNETIAVSIPQGNIWQRLLYQTHAMFSQLLNAADWTSPRWWIFLYLVLCVGSHMAPSRSDYEGSLRGALISGLVFVSCIAVLFGLQVDPLAFARSVAAVGVPLLSVLVLATALSGLATAVVVALTSLFPARGVRSDGRG